MVAAPRQAVGEGEGDGLGEVVGVGRAGCVPLGPTFRHSRAPPGARAALGRAPAAVAHFEVGIVAAEPALGEQRGGLGGGRGRNRARRPRSAYAPAAARAGWRRWRGHAAVMWPSSSIAPSRASRARASASAGPGAGRGRAGGGSASPHSRQVSSRLDRSASRISGGSWAGSAAVAASSHRRMATPAPGARRGRRAG